MVFKIRHASAHPPDFKDIEVNTIGELLDIIEREGREIIIGNNGGTYNITIYDSYIE